MSAPSRAPPARVWVEAARPRTLVAGVVPVVVGTAVAPEVIPWRFLGALVVSLALQVAVNYANDLFDALSGVDAPERPGPRRAVASGLVGARQMGAAIAVALAVAAVAGFVLAAAVSWSLLPIGALCVAAVLAYSGGRRPYGSAGLGEVFVFAFFGVVATTGSAYVQIEDLSARAIAASVPVGLLAVAILLVNNLRDIETDARAGKRTLAVRLGTRRSVVAYRAVVAGAFVAVVAVAIVDRSGWPLVALAAAAASRRPLGLVASLDRAALGKALGATASLELVAGVLLAAGLWLSR